MARGSRRSIAFALVAGCAAATLPAACLYPSYSFDEAEPTGSGGAAATTTTATNGGGGAASTTASTTTASSAGGGGSGAGTPQSETSCLDGVDDDDDGDVDCADSDCSPDYECVDPIPSGWGTFGYVELYSGDPASSPGCPDDKPTTAYTGHDQISAAPATCSQCGCDAPMNQACVLQQDLDPGVAGVQPIQVKDAPCLAAPSVIKALSVPTPWGGVCYHAESLPGGQTCGGGSCNKSVTSAAPTASGGTCSASGGVATKPSETWGVEGKACKGALSGAGCQSSKVCQPKPQAPFEAGLCVSKAGDHDCPDGLFQQKHVFYGGFDDTRGCDPCTCGGASGGSCAMTLRLFSDPTVGFCSTEVAKFTAGTCFDMVGNPDIYGWTAEITSQPVGGTCAVAGGGTANGGVVESAPTTFCCVP